MDASPRIRNITVTRRVVQRPARAAVTLAALAVLVVGLTGCLSIKQETAFQRAPGVVQLKIVVCASDYNNSHYNTCNASNVQETDNFRFDADDAAASLGQILVGYRVPNGSTGPGTFLSEAQDVSFSRSASYTQQLTSRFPPPAGFHWEGYLSTAKTFNPADASTRETAFHPEFTLPAGAAGAPFVSPFRWRGVVGFRSLNNAGEAGAAVDCSGGAFLTFCADSPPNPVPPATFSHLSAPVSDFGVLAGNAVTAGQGETANISFPIRYSDTGTMGSQPLSLTATTT